VLKIGICLQKRRGNVHFPCCVCVATMRATSTPAGALTATSGRTGKCIGLSQVQTVQSSRQPTSLLCLTPWPNLSICTVNTLFSQTHCGPLISHHHSSGRSVAVKYSWLWFFCYKFYYKMSKHGRQSQSQSQSQSSLFIRNVPDGTRYTIMWKKHVVESLL